MRRLYLFIIILALTTFISSNIYANTTYIIRKGDNPYKIAKKFKVRTQDIIEANNLMPDNLKPGTKITIPSNKKESLKEDKLTRKRDKGVSHDANTTYTIKKGDNPYKIAKKFKVRTQDIIEANNLMPDNLKPGTKITIPSNKKGTLKEDKLVRKKDEGLPPFSKGGQGEFLEDSSYHIVKRGDTLFSLSKKHSISVSELKEINNLGSIKLKPGQKLIVKKIGTKTYTVRKGDNIYSISRRFNIDLDELRDINNLESDLLKPGQKIFLEPNVESEPKTYETVLSQAPIEDETKKISESEESGLEKLNMKERLILFAKKMLDIPYRFGGSSLLGIDCSAYVQKVYSLIGINLPRSARAQFSEGNPVDKGDLSIGDLVFFRTYASFPSHVGIYLGNDLFIHASSRDKKVTIDSLDTPYYLKRFIGAKRLIEGKDEEKGDPQKKG